MRSRVGRDAMGTESCSLLSPHCWALGFIPTATRSMRLPGPSMAPALLGTSAAPVRPGEERPAMRSTQGARGLHSTKADMLYYHINLEHRRVGQSLWIREI